MMNKNKNLIIKRNLIVKTNRIIRTNHSIIIYLINKTTITMKMHYITRKNNKKINRLIQKK
jgi:hypothetical protein